MVRPQEDGSTPPGTSLKARGLRCRTEVTPTLDGLHLRITLMHFGARPLHNLRLAPLTLDVTPLTVAKLQAGETKVVGGMIALTPEGGVRFTPIAAP